MESSAAAYSSRPLPPLGMRTATSSSRSVCSRSLPHAPSTSRTAWAANRSTCAVSGRRGSSQYQPQLANIASREAWARMSVSSRSPGRGVAGSPGTVQLVRDPAGGVSIAAGHVHVPVPGGPGIQAHGGQVALGERVDGAREPVERLAQGRLPAAVGGAAALGRPAGDTVMAGPAGAFRDIRDRQVVRVERAEPGAG